MPRKSCTTNLVTAKVEEGKWSNWTVIKRQLISFLYNCSNPKEFWGWDFVLALLFFFFSVFVDFLNCVFWHLWYIIRKLLKSSFICTEASFSGLFVWKIWGFKVFQNSPIKDRTCSTSRRKFRQIQDHIKNISKLIN